MIKKRTMWIWLAVILGGLFLAWVAYGYFAVRSVEQLGYTVVEQKEGYEIRQYPAHIRAQTQVSGNVAEAGNQAFGIVAGYIFGDNTTRQKIAMTTPVISETSQKIAMTTPIIQDEAAGSFAFVIPSQYQLEDLPIPNDNRVELVEVPAQRIAALRFRGFFLGGRFEAKKLQLIEALERDDLNYGAVSSVGYNPPFTPPFMTRLEVWAELE